MRPALIDTFDKGPIVRLGPNLLCFNTETAMRTIYARQANVCKDKGYAAMSASRRTTNTLSAIEKDDVNFQRRIHARSLSDGNLRAMGSGLLEKVEVFVGLLTDSQDNPTPSTRTTWGSVKNVSERCIWLTFDIITDLCYGEGLGMMTNPENRWFCRAIRAMSWRAMMVRSQLSD